MSLQPRAEIARSDLEMQAPSGDRTGESYSLSSELVTLGSDGGRHTHAIELLVTQIIGRQVEAGRRGLTVCGASKGVGVTFTAGNIAVALSQAGISTLLIDGNLRDPGVSRLIAPDGDARGLLQFLESDDLTRRDIIRSEVLPNLSIIYAGGSSPNAAELLSSDAFRNLIGSCLRDFAFTVIDTPPANQWTDALTIAKLTTYALLVARRDQSYVEDVSTLAQELAKDGVTLVATVMNGA
jgi:receptor protein-tyrosine kinase